MKKNKFLSGLGAKLALAIVALTTTMFTSCEKENIEIEVTPVNAKAYIEATVYDATTGQDVTALAKITGAETLEGNPTLNSQTVTVTATYNGMTDSKTVNVPALKASESWSTTVALVLTDNSIEVITTEHTTIETETKVEGYQDNTTDYWWYTTVTYPKTTGSKVIASDYEGSNEQILNLIKENNKGIQHAKAVSEKLVLGAHGRLVATVTTTKTITVYQVKSVGTTSTILANFTVESYNTVLTTQTTDIPGHGHSHAGHGHGHGDDNNAGGGIIIAD